MNKVQKKVRSGRQFEEENEIRRLRRHTWDFSAQHQQDHSKFPHFLISDDQRCSSSSSVKEVIKECLSDEEKEGDNHTEVEYMRCKNCNIGEGGVKDMVLQTMNYCFKWKHLFAGKVDHIFSTHTNSRPLSWGGWDGNSSGGFSRQYARRGSLVGSLSDLPTIAEPESSDHHDLVNIERSQKQDVDNLEQSQKEFDDALVLEENDSPAGLLKSRFLSKFKASSRWLIPIQDMKKNS